MENILVVTVKEESAAYAALADLQDLADQHAVNLRGAAIIERHDDGRWHIPEETEQASHEGTVTAGFVGALLGALIGPAGIVAGGVAGVAFGSAAEARDASSVQRTLERFPRLVPPGTTALVADVEEVAPAVLDGVLGAYGTVGRMPRADVEQELA